MKTVKRNYVIRFLAIFIAVFIACAMVWGSRSAAPVAYADSTYLEMDGTDVMDDLSGITVNGQPFDAADYGADKSKDVQVLTFVEYSYSYYGNLRGNYALYVYVWNPQKTNYVTLSRLNAVSLRFGGDETTDYEKYPLLFLDGSDDGLFYKFRVTLTADDKTSIFKALDSTKRVYEISEIELLESGETNPTAIPVAAKYTYTGYAAGLGEQTGGVSTLGLQVEGTDVVETEAHYTFYRYPRTQTTKTQVNSVYFAIDGDYDFLEDYDDLYAIDAEYYKYLTTPIVVTSNKDFYDAQQDWIGVDIGEDGDENNQWAMYADHSVLPWWVALVSVPGLIAIHRNAGFAYNHASFPWNVSVSDDAVFMTKIPYLFYTDGVDNNEYLLERDKVESWWADYTDEFGNGHGNIYGYNDDLFVDYDLDGDDQSDDPYHRIHITADDSFDLPASDYGNWFNNWWYGLFLGDYPVVEDISPIVEVTEKDINSVSSITDDLLIDESDVDEFKSYCQEQFSQGRRVYLFRFDVSEYSAENIIVDKHGITAWDTGSTDIRQEFVYFGFDFISFEFHDDYGNQKIVGVASSPIDGVADFTPPNQTTPGEGFNFWEWLRELISSNDWLKWVIAIVALIVLLPILVYLLPVVIKVVVWVISLPFKLIKAIGKLFKKKE